VRFGYAPYGVDERLAVLFESARGHRVLAEHLRENVAAVSLQLPTEAVEKLNAIGGNVGR
jgi:hypothetical protein